MQYLSITESALFTVSSPRNFLKALTPMTSKRLITHNAQHHSLLQEEEMKKEAQLRGSNLSKISQQKQNRL